MMKMNEHNESQTSKEDQSIRYQKQVDSAIRESCKQYEQKRKEAEDTINQGARITRHQIKL